MKRIRFLTVLVTVTLALQVVSLYRQYRPADRRPRSEPVREAPKGTVVDISGLPSEGSPSAAVVLVEFSDFECPYCARHAADVGKLLAKRFIHSGQIRHVFANNPLPMHPNARMLASAASCAGSQGQFWKMHDALFEEKPKGEEDLLKIASGLGLDQSLFRQCAANGTNVKARIDADVLKAKNLDLGGTPAFVVGRVDPNGQLRATKLITGAVPIEVFEKAIQETLDSRS